METYHKIQTLFKRDLDGSLTGQKGKMIEGQWTTPDLEYLAGNEWEFTEKVDGTNIRIGYSYLRGDHASQSMVGFAGRSDNATIPEPLKRYLYETFPREKFWEVFPARQSETVNVILFGEGYGPKIQNGGLYRNDQSFVLFDVKIGDWWLLRKDVDDIAKELGIDSVPTIGYGTLYDAIEMVKSWPLGTGPLLSTWGDFEAEGIVARPRVPLFNRKGERIITKIKAVDFR